MNLLLLEPDELSSDGIAHLTGRRASHALEVLRAQPGDTLRVGVVGGRMGTGRVVEAAHHRLEPLLRLAVDLHDDPPPPAPVQLLLAVPRPKVLRRVLQAAAAMGVPRIVLLGSYRVEKSYFSSPFLEPEAVARELRLGLEQGRDTRLPEVALRRRFRPFVEDELDGWAGDAQRLLAEPGARTGLGAVQRRSGRAILAVGPEGGFTPYEAGALAGRGFEAFSLGPRVLRVETAVPFALGQVALWIGR